MKQEQSGTEYLLVMLSVSDPHSFYADPGKNLNADPDPGGKGKR